MPGHEVIGEEELEEITNIFRNGGVLFRNGFEQRRNGVNCTKKFEGEFASRMGARHALAVSSGTAALRVALAAIGVKEGDEVITQAFTFVATVEAIIESRATPVCVDIDKTLNLCPRRLEEAITEKTKAVIVVHMLGGPARIREVCEICKRHGIALIEDTAWGCGGDVEGIPLGMWGDIGTYSFDFAKTITTGEGGMVVTNNRHLWSRAAAWHDHGHENNPAVPRWEDTRQSSGFNFRMCELQSAVGIAQLNKLDWIISKQRDKLKEVWERVGRIKGVELRDEPKGAHGTADGLVLLVADKTKARECREQLMSKNIGTKILPEAITWHYAGYWDHMKELKARCGPDLAARYRQSSEILDRAVCIPITLSMDAGSPELISDAIKVALEGSTHG